MAPGASTVVADVGVPQQTLVSDALARILAGELDVALVVGGEARRARLAETGQQGVEPEVRLPPMGEIITRREVEAGLGLPVRAYALIENALGRSDLDAQWLAFREVARRNPRLAFQVVSHKGLRPLVPWAILAAALSSVPLAGRRRWACRSWRSPTCRCS